MLDRKWRLRLGSSERFGVLLEVFPRHDELMLAGISAHEKGVKGTYSDGDPGPWWLTMAPTSVRYIVVILPYIV